LTGGLPEIGAALDGAIGLRFVGREGERVRLRLEPLPAAVVAGDGGPDYLHGGALATCVDSAAWYAVEAARAGTWVVSNLRLDFLRLARPEAHTVTAVARRVGRAQAVADVEIAPEDDPARPVALGRVTLTDVG
jgi:uncharacterized protein (TIGR00369 family)